MEAISIQVPAMARGGAVRVLKFRVAELSPRQREVLDWLPRDRKGTTPVLRGPGKTPKATACFVDIGGGELVPADFAFKVPEKAIDEDVPGLLDMWRGELETRCSQIREKASKRAARQASAAAKQARPRRGKKAPGVTAGNDEATSDATSEATSGGEVPSEVVAAETPAPTPGSPAASVEVCEADSNAGIGQVYRVLPLLSNIELEPIAGLDSLVLEGEVWSAVVQVKGFDTQGVVLRRIDEALQRAYGLDWRDPELVEDIDTRIEQAFGDADAAHAEFMSWVETYKPKPSKAAARKPAEGEKPARRRKAEVPLTSGLGPLMDLARQIFVDLCTATHSARQILEQLEAHPAWAADYAHAVQRLEIRILPGLQAAELAARMSLLDDWSEALSSIEASSQMGLWTQEDHRRLQRAVEPQVRRAHLWRKALAVHPLEVGAAIAVLGLVN